MQGERGTTEHLPIASPNRNRLIIGGTVAGLILADQLTKLFIRLSFALGESVPVFGDFFRLTYIHNDAGAFGISFGHPAIYFVASTVIAVLIVVSLYRAPDLRLWAVWGFALVLSGAVGNLIDRVCFGAVTDFLDLEFFDMNLPSFSFLFIKFRGYTMTRWPIFNLADSAIDLGIGLLILSIWLDGRKKPASDCPPVDVSA